MYYDWSGGTIFTISRCNLLRKNFTLHIEGKFNDTVCVSEKFFTIAQNSLYQDFTISRLGKEFYPIGEREFKATIPKQETCSVKLYRQKSQNISDITLSHIK